MRIPGFELSVHFSPFSHQAPGRPETLPLAV
jgi:hypothetical protein